jgi:hypothetical protein
MVKGIKTLGFVVSSLVASILAQQGHVPGNASYDYVGKWSSFACLYYVHFFCQVAD